tara:strand:+ start:105867 stop:109295 length:3429 start_codon:yes stop_codon:yes gene_type:complete
MGNVRFHTLTYTKVGRVLDYGIIGNYGIVDKSPEGNDAILYTGRGISTDGSIDKGINANVTTTSDVWTLTGKVKTNGEVNLQIDDSADGSGVLAGLDTGTWEDFSINFNMAGFVSASNVVIGWSNEVGFADSADWSDIRLMSGNTVVAHWTLADRADVGLTGLNGLSLTDSSGNGFHGSCIGCNGFTGEGIDPLFVPITDETLPYFAGDNAASVGFSDVTFAGDLAVSFKTHIIDLDGTSGTVDGAHFLADIGGSARIYYDVGSPSFGVSDDSGSITAWTSVSTLAAGVDYDIQVTRISGVWNLTINGIDKGAPAFGSASGTMTLNAWGALRGAATSITALNGVIYDINLGSAAWGGSTPYTDTIGSNNGTESGTFVTVGQKRATIPQTADKNWNKYMQFYGDATGSTGVSIPVENLLGDFNMSAHLYGNTKGMFFSNADGAFGGGLTRIYYNSGSGSIVMTDNDGTHAALFSGVFPVGQFLNNLVQITRVGTTISLYIDNAFISSVEDAGISRFVIDSIGGWRNSGGLIYGWTGTITNVSLQGSKWSGYGNTDADWTDISGRGSNGVVYGSPENWLVSASGSVDAFGQPIRSQRVNGEVFNSFGDGENFTQPTTIGNIYLVTGWFYWDGDTSAQTICDLGTPQFIQSGGNISATGITAPTYYVDGVVAQSLSVSGWHYVAVSSASLISDSGLTNPETTGGFVFYNNSVVPLDTVVYNYAAIQSKYAVHSVANITAYGDSLSTNSLYPADLRIELDTSVLANAVGGTQSQDILARANLDELAYPIAGTDTITAGTIPLRSMRYQTGRLASSAYSYNNLDEYSRTSGPQPTRVEFFNNGVKIAEATESVNLDVTIDYATSTTNINCGIGSEPSVGDAVYFQTRDTSLAPYLQYNAMPKPVDTSSDNTGGAGLVLWRVYTVRSVGSGSFTVEFNDGDGVDVNLGSDPSGLIMATFGYQADWEYAGGAWDITISVDSPQDANISIIWMGTNNFTNLTVSQLAQVQSDIQSIIARLTTSKFLVVPAMTGAYADRTPTTKAVTDNNDLQAWLNSEYPNNVCDIKSVLYGVRAQSEIDLMTDPAVDELLNIGGTQNAPVIGGGTLQWIGPNYLPLQHRADLIHPDYDRAATRAIITDTFVNFITAKGW